MTQITFAAVTLLILAACAFLLWQQRRHYESLLRDARADNRDLRDRMFATRNLPPAGVDMKAEREQKQAERRQREADPNLKSAPDPTWQMRSRLAEKEKRRLVGQK